MHYWSRPRRNGDFMMAENGTPQRRMKREGRRAQLMETARAIIENEGVSALTMAGLSERAGVSKPVVYDHFDNSEDVIVALLVDYHQALAQSSRDEVAQARDLGDFFDRSVDINFSFRAKSQLAIRNITNGYISSERINKLYWRIQDRVVRIYSEVLKQYGLPDNKAHYVAFALKEMTTSYTSVFCTEEDTQMARDALKEMIRGALADMVPLDGPSPVVPPIGSLGD